MPDAANVHYTLGGPYFDEFRECEHAQAWQHEKLSLLRVDQRAPSLSRKASGSANRQGVA
jgi:hypothetical protein